MVQNGNKRTHGPKPLVDRRTPIRWLLSHKLRPAMVNPDRTPLQGDVCSCATEMAYAPR